MITAGLVAFVAVGADHIHIQLRLCSFGCRRWCGHTTLGRVAAYSVAGAVESRLGAGRSDSTIPGRRRCLRYCRIAGSFAALHRRIMVLRLAECVIWSFPDGSLLS